MIKELFNSILFNPLYNGLIYLIDVVPGADVGIAVILLTIIVKLIIFPLSKSAVRTQIKMKILQEPLKEIQVEYKDNKEEQARKMMALYKEHKINPFSSILLIFIQIPVILALYWVFFRGGLPEINQEILYSFISVPEVINMNFLGFVDISQTKVLSIALIAAITQFFQARYSFPKPPEKKPGEAPSFKDDMVRGMSIQMKYVLPIITFFISYTFIAVIGLYWIVSNLFAIGQEVYIRNHIKKPAESSE